MTGTSSIQRFLFITASTSNPSISGMTISSRSRNGESGQHVLHIRALTELFLHHLQHKTDRYPLSQADVSLISTASALHDIGKISIPDEVLNKPGRLTDQEFEIMKTHTVVGSQMMDNLPKWC